jgi:hypothetical protein
MTDREDAQRLPGEILAFILQCVRELELQRALAGVAKAGATKIVARRARSVLSGERGVDHLVDALGKAGAMVVIEGQNGTSWDFARRDISEP